MLLKNPKASKSPINIPVATKEEIEPQSFCGLYLKHELWIIEYLLRPNLILIYAPRLF